MRQAHPRNQTRHRFLAAGLALSLGGSAIVALGAVASDRPAGAGGGVVAAGGGAGAGRSVTSIAAGVDRASGDEPEARWDGSPFASALTPPGRLADQSARAELGAVRPQVSIPVVAPRVVPRAPAGSRIVVLGDSYTSGWNGAGLGSRNWTRIVGRSRGWTVVDLAVPGTGFVNPGWTQQPVGTLVAATIRQRPDVVILASGHNDSRWSRSAVDDAADRVIDRLRAGLPDAVIVVVAPIWQDGSPPTRCLALRDHLRRTAAAVGAIFIDPLAERWYAGPNHRYIGPDGVHPTNAGHAHMAARVLADLARVLAG